MELSIVIINFRTFDLTVNCIRTIQEFGAGINYEIILVDNAPRENYEPRFKALFPEIKYLSTKENVGFGRANNLGIELAEGQYILLLNSDTLLIDNSLKRCLDFMNDPANQKVGLLGCKLLNEDLSYQASFYPFLKSTLWNFLKTDNPILHKIYKVKELYKAPQTTTQVGDVSGAFMFVRKEVIDRLKPFDPDFFLYFEETEWCKVRISRYYKIIYYPAAQVIHLGGQSTPKNFLFTQFHLSMALYWYKEGWLKYFPYIIYRYANIFFLLGMLILGKGKTHFKQYFTTYIELFPYLLYKIPKFSSAYGSRKEPLIFEKAKKYFIN